MGRRLKVVIAVLAALLALLLLNAFLTDGETESAEITEPGGRIFKLPGGDLQVVDHNPQGSAPIVLIHCFSSRSTGGMGWCRNWNATTA